MIPTRCAHPAPLPAPSYHRTLATALHLDALTLVIHLHLLQMCRTAVQLAQRHCPPPLPAGPGGAPRVYTEEGLSDEALFLLPLSGRRPTPLLIEPVGVRQEGEGLVQLIVRYHLSGALLACCATNQGAEAPW
jgi:hypothetical protein